VPSGEFVIAYHRYNTRPILLHHNIRRLLFIDPIDSVNSLERLGIMLSYGVTLIIRYDIPMHVISFYMHTNHHT